MSPLSNLPPPPASLTLASGREAPVEQRPPHVDHELARQLMQQGRSALILRPRIASSLSSALIAQSRKLLDAEMALIPEGMTTLIGRNWLEDASEGTAAHTYVAVEAFLLDRFAVTNRRYADFVRSGGYEQSTLWDDPVKEALHEFVDQTGHVGPRLWRDGTYPAEWSEHPVVGVSWYEALAYARWVGKRLPTDAEWVKAASWPTVAGRQIEHRKYPWGDIFDLKCANLWDTRVLATCPVQAFPGGDNPVGIRQLTGNVWEWTSTSFGAYDQGADFLGENVLLKSLRGGAYDTYFAEQASWQFQSGDDALARRHNVGFRCALSLCDVVGLEGDHA